MPTATALINSHEHGLLEDKHLDTVRFLNEIKIDGRSPLTMEHLKFVVGHIRLWLHSKRNLGRIVDLRRVLSLSISISDQDFEASIRQLMRATRIPNEELHPKLKEILVVWAALPPVRYDLV